MTGRRWAGRVLRLLPLGWGYACGEFLKAMPMTHVQMWQFGALAASAWLIGMALMWQLLHDRQRCRNAGHRLNCHPARRLDRIETR